MATTLKPQPPSRQPLPPSGRGAKPAHQRAMPHSKAFDELLREVTQSAATSNAPLTSRPSSRQPADGLGPAAAPFTARGAGKAAAGVLKERNVNSDSSVKRPPSFTNAISDPRTAALLAQIKANADATKSTAATARSASAPKPVRDEVTTLETSTSRPTSARDDSAVGLTWQEATARHGAQLTKYEQREIREFPSVYYCGQRCARKIHGAETSGNNNYGFDDSHGDYKVILEDHIAYRYQLVNALGRGSFGLVSKAIDHKTGAQVAVKIIKNKKKFHEQALVEVKVLKHLNNKDADGGFRVVRMLSNFIFRSHMIIIFELQGKSLYDLHKASRFAPMTEAAIRNFGRQMLQTLVLTHREHVVHCDLKPENVLLQLGSSSGISVIDFGSACFDSERLYTYIQSRFYRAPEVLLGIPYTPAIDVWSLGCMLAEFSNGYPLFPGESEGEQMQLIMETLGHPPRAMLDRAPRKRTFFDSIGAPKIAPNSRGKVHRPNTKSLASFVQCTNPDFLDLLKGLLEFEPEKRLSPLDALNHPFFTGGAAKPAPSQQSGGAAYLPRLPGTKPTRW